MNFVYRQIESGAKEMEFVYWLFVLLSTDPAVTFLDIGDLKLSFGLFGSKLRRTPEKKEVSEWLRKPLPCSFGWSERLCSPLWPAIARSLFTRTAPCVECSYSAIGSEVSGIHVWGQFEPQDLCFFCTGFSPRCLSGRARVVAFVGML